jgi:hypothetical protein
MFSCDLPHFLPLLSMNDSHFWSYVIACSGKAKNLPPKPQPVTIILWPSTLSEWKLTQMGPMGKASLGQVMFNF